MGRLSDQQPLATLRDNRRGSLPLPLTSFVGREREIDALCALLDGARLLTITGAGGSGKTRLALEVAGRVVPAYPDGVAWIELAPIVDPRNVATHVATVLGIREDAAPTTEEALIGTLRGQTRLLVFDNCEHVLDAATQLIKLLLGSCPDLRVLATSREALGLGGERSWLAPTLSLPTSQLDEPLSVAEALESEAVRLFVERARDAVADFAITDANVRSIVRICRRVDGLPLALELAAARVRVLPPEQIATRLEDSFRVLATGGHGVVPRHRTLRAAIDWSYDLLTDAERTLLGRLAVFSGGFTLEAAERVCAGDPIAETEVLDHLADLVGKSLVAMQETHGTARYRLLESVRQYAHERFQESDRDAVAQLRRRHAEYYRDLAIVAEAGTIVGNESWMKRLDAEADNCRAALAWSHANGLDAPIGLPLAGSLVWYWYHRSLWREGAQALELALADATDATPLARARALHGTGIFANYVGDLDFADARFRDAEAIWRTDDTSTSKRWLAFTLIGRCTVALATGRYDDAERLAEESMVVARRTGDPWDAALAGGYALMAVKVWRKDWLSADAVLAEAERVFRARDYQFGLAFTLDARAYVALQLGENERSAALAVGALALLRARPDHWLASRSVRILAALAARVRYLDVAATLLGAADAMLASIGARALTSEREGVAGVEAAVRTQLSAAQFDQAYRAGRSMTLQEASSYAMQHGLAFDHGVTATDAEPLGTGDAGTPVLEVRALGPLEVRRAGVLMSHDAWRYAKPRELLLYLMTHRAGRTRDQIGLTFWPDASAAQVKNNFHVALHQLRRALGTADLVVFDGERYVVNWALGVELDAHRFDEDVRAALRSRDGALPLLERALAAYAGDFLEDANAGDWHLEYRDHLQRLYADGLLAFGQMLAQAGRVDDEAEAYRRLLSRDPLHEEAHRRLIASLANAGRRSEALRQYDRLVEILDRELEAEPDAATVALVERIRRGDVHPVSR
jgi:predicted ATPase/DNA-binding SARP family transcriptional activator